MNNNFAFIYQNIFGRDFYDEHISFCDFLFDEGLYFPIGLTTLISSLFSCIFFYYIINRPSFSRWYNWVIIGVCNFAICYSIAYLISYDSLNSLYPNVFRASEFKEFSFLNGTISFFYYTISMLLFRWWSTNAKQTPFPH